MATDDVSILLNARDQASAKIDAVQKKLGALGSMNIGTLLSVGGATAGLSLMASAARKTADAMERLHTGAYGTKEAIIASIPFVGELAIQMARVRDEITGAADKARDWERSVRLMHQEAAVNLEARALRDQLETREKLRNAEDDYEKNLVGITAEHDKQLRLLGKMARVEMDQVAIDRTALAIQREFNAAIEAEYQAWKKAENEKDRKRFDAQSDLDRQLSINRLKLLGEEEKAEIASIRARFAAQIREAARARDEETRLKVVELMNQELELAKRQRDKATTKPDLGGSLTALESRFAFSAPGYDSPDLKAAQTTANGVKRLVSEMTKLNQTTTAMQRNASQGGVTIVSGGTL